MRDNAMYSIMQVQFTCSSKPHELSFTMTSSQQQGLPLHSCAYMIMHAVCACSYMREYSYRMGVAGASKASPPACIIMIIRLSTLSFLLA